MKQLDVIVKGKAKRNLIDQIIEINKSLCDQQGVDWFMLSFVDRWKKELQNNSISSLKMELKLKQDTSLIGKKFKGLYPNGEWSDVRTIVKLNEVFITDNKGTGWFLLSIKLVK